MSREASQTSVWGGPALGAAGMLILGIALHGVLPPCPAGYLLAAGGLAMVGALGGRWLGSAAIAGALMAFGVGAAQVDRYQYPINHIGAFAGDESKMAWVEVELDTTPRRMHTAHRGERQVVTGWARGVLTSTGWVETCGWVGLQVEGKEPALAAGERVRVLGMLQRPAAAMNPGQFDWAEYYREQGVLASVLVNRAGNVQILSREAPPLLTRMRDGCRGLLEAGFGRERSLDHALLRALVLGDSDPELRDVQEDFRKTGTSHHLAISGMHIAVLGGVVMLLCRLMQLRPRWTAWIVLVFVVFYGLMALPSPPVVRSVLLCVAFSTGVLLRRSVNAVQMLAVSVFAMLVYHPLDLFNAGFQLSFGTVMGLLVLVPPLVRIAYRPELIPVTMKPTQGQALWIRFKHWMGMAIATGAVAWAVSAPLIAYHFEQLNPWSITAGIVLGPVVFLSLIGGFAKMVLTGLLPWGAGWWAMLAGAPISWMRHLVDWLAMIPLSDAPMPSPPIGLMVVYYALLALPLVIRAEGRWRKVARAGPIAAGIVALSVPAMAWAVQANRPAALRVDVVAVGAGSCCIVRPAHGPAILVDCGSSTFADVYRTNVAPMLRHRQIGRIDSIFLTHANVDHFNAAEEVIDNCGVRRVYVDPTFESGGASNSEVRQFLKAMRGAGLKPEGISRGRKIAIDEETTIEVLWPGEDLKLPENDRSLVLKLSYGGRSILFTGDIQELAERQLTTLAEHLRSDVLVAPHHGSAESTTEAFVRAVDPGIIVSSNGRVLTRKQRVFEDAIGTRPLYRTNVRGAITLTLGRDGRIDVATFR